MKKNIIIIASIVAATALLFSSCSKNEVLSNESKAKTVEFFAKSIDTKTAFTTPVGSSYPTLWTASDETVKILQNVTGSPVAATVTPSVGGATAKLTASIDSDGSGSYTFYAVSPASAFTSYNKSYKNFNVTVSANQTPSATSVDEGVMLIAAKSSTYSPDFPTAVDLDFAHATAYGKLTLSNLGLGVGETIKTVKLTTTSSKWVGSGFYYIEDYDVYSAGDLIPASTALKELTINTSSASDIWFACIPAAVAGETINVLVTTNKYTYSRDITVPAGKNFVSGQISSFTVNMSAATKTEAPAYTLTPAATGGNETPHNSYAAAATTTISGIGWSVTGNSSMVPWRIGGKGTDVDRAIFSTSAIKENINSIVITHGDAGSNLPTVNSMKVYVCSSAEGAAASTPSDVVASFTPSFANNDSVTITKVGSTSWANCYYRIVYNFTNSGSKNKYILFSEVKFFE